MRLVSLAVLSALAAPAWAETPFPLNDSRFDVLSFGNPDEVLVNDVRLDLDVDFNRKTLEGTAELALKRIKPKAKDLVLDTRELTIKEVECFCDGRWKRITFDMGTADALLGTPLTVHLPDGVDKVRVHYRTSPKASGLQWLEPVQTAGKKQPFLFSQSQAIHARSWAPLQDSPAVRITYSAHLKTPKNLMAVMSADNSANKERDGDYEFIMPQAIPSYLMAIAVGDLAYQPMAGITGVYAEPSVLAKAAAEFEDTQKMVVATESLFGPYRWGQYDLLILPPSFPYGGMENPRLSFITPTTIAGDKSLVSIIAHELAHSWSGNLVTNATWGDGWLNEGFTSYVENREMEVLYGRERAVMEQVLSLKELNEEFATAEPRFTTMASRPDPAEGEGSQTVPSQYTKGQQFLVYLEQKFGRERFDPFLKGWFDSHAFQSVTTEDFVRYLDENLLQKAPGTVTLEQVRAWIYAPGMPADAPVHESDAFKTVDAQREAWLKGEKKAAELDTGAWIFHQWRYLLATLPAELSLEQMAELDAAFKFTQTGNAELAHAWLKLAIQKGYKPADARLKDYLVQIGRRRLIVPLYEELAKTPEGRARAQAIYRVARPGYHPIAQGTVDKLLGVKA
ncbi:MAG: M1 family metallopeptidase [Gammaproteobacteria bacterium]|nr:M1 family metallopeptidase [Gammaproteobacteria bacterium]